MPRSSYCAWTQPRVTCTTWMTRGWQIPATRDGWASEDVSLRVQALVIGTAELEGLELCRSGAATHTCVVCISGMALVDSRNVSQPQVTTPRLAPRPDLQESAHVCVMIV